MKIPHDIPITLSELSKALKIGRNRINQDRADGYVLEFPAMKRTSVNHYLAWHRGRSDAKPATQQGLEREANRLRSISDKGNAQKLSRGSRTALPKPKKHSRSAQPA